MRVLSMGHLAVKSGVTRGGKEGHMWEKRGEGAGDESETYPTTGQTQKGHTP